MLVFVTQRASGDRHRPGGRRREVRLHRGYRVRYLRLRHGRCSAPQPQLRHQRRLQQARDHRGRQEEGHRADLHRTALLCRVMIQTRYTTKNEPRRRHFIRKCLLLFESRVIDRAGQQWYNDKNKSRFVG